MTVFCRYPRQQGLAMPIPPRKRFSWGVGQGRSAVVGDDRTFADALRARVPRRLRQNLAQPPLGPDANLCRVGLQLQSNAGVPSSMTRTLSEPLRPASRPSGDRSLATTELGPGFASPPALPCCDDLAHPARDPDASLSRIGLEPLVLSHPALCHTLALHGSTGRNPNRKCAMLWAALECCCAPRLVLACTFEESEMGRVTVSKGAVQAVGVRELRAAIDENARQLAHGETDSGADTRRALLTSITAVLNGSLTKRDASEVTKAARRATKVMKGRHLALRAAAALLNSEVRV